MFGLFSVRNCWYFAADQKETYEQRGIYVTGDGSKYYQCFGMRPGTCRFTEIYDLYTGDDLDRIISAGTSFVGTKER